MRGRASPASLPLAGVDAYAPEAIGLHRAIPIFDHAITGHPGLDVQLGRDRHRFDEDGGRRAGSCVILFVFFAQNS